MSIVKYEIFEEIIKTGSFTKASQNLNMTQSAVSHAISSLEKELGTTLFIRESRQIRLTSTGSKTYQYINEILKLNRDLIDMNFSNSSPLPKVLKIGAFSSINNHVLTQVIQNFNKVYPFIKVVVFEGTYDEINDWLMEKFIDIGFTITQNSKLISSPFLKDELLIASSKPININNYNSLQYFFNNNNVIMPTAPYSKQIDIFFEKHNIVPNIHSYISDCDTIVKMIKLNIGISVGPKLFLSSFDNIKLCALPEKHYRNIYISFHDINKTNAYINEFIKMARALV